MPDALGDETDAFRQSLLGWYDRSARSLPWRGEGRTPYRVFVSEFMLQQTQVKTVIPYFERFVAELPTVQALAEADEQTVLRLWQGLGYYSRGRNLHKAARLIVSEHGGEVPRTVDELLKLPGVGRYTAGAIASIAYNTVAPILDGNVMRVLCRIEKIEADPRQPAVQKELWKLAEATVDPDRPGDFNSAMMELGATVCIPKTPQCLICPVAEYCAAKSAGVQDRIPPPKVAKATPLSERDLYRIRDDRGRLLVEQRPATGRWANLWQFITAKQGEPPPLKTTPPVEVGIVRHGLTHRRYVFRVFDCEAAEPHQGVWVTPDELDAYPMSKPQLAAAKMPRKADARRTTSDQRQ